MLPSNDRGADRVTRGARRRARSSEIELVVYATDVSDYPEADEARDFELEYSSRTSGARRDGSRDPRIGGDQRPRAPDHARRARSRPTVAGCGTSRSSTRTATPTSPAIAAFRYVASYPPTSAAYLERTRERLERFRAVPPVRALLAEVRLAQERAGARRACALRRADRPPHAGRVRAERRRRGADRARARHVGRRASPAAGGRDRDRGRGGRALAPATAPRGARRTVRRRALPVPTPPARARPSSSARTAGDVGLDPTFRGDAPWPDELKRALIDRGYALTEEALAESNFETCIEPSRLEPRRGRDAAATSGIRAYQRSPLEEWGTAPERKVGRGPGRRSDPLPMK